MTNLNLAIVLEEVQEHLKFLAEAGIKGVDCSAASRSCVASWGKPPSPAAAPLTLDRIRAEIGECRRCPLHVNRRQIVFGQGDPKARIMFIGEAPGHDEDLSGIPFSGASGELLTKIIHAMKLTRDQVYICNVVKCRPPENRNPQPVEIEACSVFLRRQIRAIKPKFICALGVFAAQALLDTNHPLSRLRGKFHALGEISVMPTYHPAALLRNPQMKRDVWEDIKKIMIACGLPLP